MKEILDVLKEINIRLANLEKIAGIKVVNNNEAKLTDKQIEEIKSKWKKYKKGE